MAWQPMYFDVINAAFNGEAAREAERRAMYARPDAAPLPDDAAQARSSRRISVLWASVSKALLPALGVLRRPGREAPDRA